MNRTKAIINTKSIRHNLRIIRQKSGTKIIGIVKANGYGFGMYQISKVLREEDVEMLGVPYVHEAVNLREKGDTGEILLTGTLSDEQVEDVVKHNLQISIVNLKVLEYLNSVAKRENKIAKMHIFVDTGMNREGVKMDELDKFLESVSGYGNLKVVGALTHLIASDDEDKTQTNEQVNLFELAVEKIENKFGKLDYVHTHNSGAIFNNIRNIGNYSRPGIAIYGFLPNEKLANDCDLQSGLDLVSEVSLVKTVNKGETIGYSNKYIAKNEMKIALIPFGYGHGYPWALFNKGVFEINGQKCQIVGSVCMDFTMVEVTGIDASVGDEVKIMSDNGISDSIYDISRKAETIPYEIITHLLPRIDRDYI